MTRVRVISILMACQWLAAGHVARADQTDPRLADLFAQLEHARSQVESGPIVQRIWSIWGQSGQPEVDTVFLQGVRALANDEEDAAIAAFTRVIELAPGFAEGWNKRATALFLKGRLLDAEADIARVLSLEPRHFGALAGLGMCEAGRDRLPEALAAFEQALSVNPQMPGLRERVRLLREQVGRQAI